MYKIDRRGGWGGVQKSYTRKLPIFVKMDSMSGCDIRLVFTSSLKDSTPLNNFP